jgi:hypothetical protein
MIRLNTILKQLNEIGDKPYPWDYEFEDNEGNVLYKFSSPKYDYSVAFNLMDESYYEMFFNPIEGPVKDTEEGVALKVMSTVFDIMASFANQYQPEEIKVTPIQTKGTEDSRRYNVYKAYMQKTKPQGYQMVDLGGALYWIKK